MTTAILQDTTSPPGSNQKYRPYASPNHHVTKGRYITSNDPRGYIPVYEYPLNGQWIMMDIDDGYILWTGIWKALGNSKADIVKMVDSQPELASQIRRVRGGYLKIQGTWMPYDVALRLARRVAWSIRDDLIPLFGPTFPSTCLSPDQPGFGQVVASGPGRRRVRRNTQPIAPSRNVVLWDLSSPRPGPAFPMGRQTTSNLVPPHPLYGHQPNRIPTASTHPARYAPYPIFPHSTAIGDDISLSRRRSSDGSQLDTPSPLEPYSFRGEIVLPPIRSHPDLAAPLRRSSIDTGYALPPISALEDLRGVNASDNSASAVLKRLRERDDDEDSDDSQTCWPRKRSPSASALNRAPPPSSWCHPQPSLTGPPHVYPGVSKSFPHSSVLGSREHKRQPRHSQSLESLSTLSVPQSSSADDGLSTSDLSPISPATPHSPAASEPVTEHRSQPLSILRGPGIRDHSEMNSVSSRVSSTSPPYTYAVPQSELSVKNTHSHSTLYRSNPASVSSSPSPTSVSSYNVRPW